MLQQALSRYSEAILNCVVNGVHVALRVHIRSSTGGLSWSPADKTQSMYYTRCPFWRDLWLKKLGNGYIIGNELWFGSGYVPLGIHKFQKNSTRKSLLQFNLGCLLIKKDYGCSFLCYLFIMQNYDKLIEIYREYEFIIGVTLHRISRA